MIVRASKDYRWLEARTGYWAGPDFRSIECVAPDGRILAMVGYDRWTPNSVQMHVAVDSPIAIRHLLGPAFAYPFMESDRSLVIGYVPASNRSVVRLAKRLGFIRSHEVKDGWSDGVPLVLFEMRREQCRFIPQIRSAA